MAATFAAALPVTIGIVRTYWMAHGDGVVMSELLRRTDVTAFLATMLVMSINSGVLLLFVTGYRFALKMTMDATERERVFPLRRYLAICLPLLAIMVLITTGPAALVLVAVFAVINGARNNESAQSLRELVTNAVMMLVAVMMLIANTYSPPPELVQVKADKPQWVYVIAVEDSHTTVLHVGGGIERISNSEVTGRALCPESQVYGGAQGWRSWFVDSRHLSIARIWLRDSDERIPDLCTQAPKVPVSFGTA
ncbi:hypothetical protein KRM28CT15_10610 [Krasilnikovia sp. M28-CT-15]